MTMLEWLRARLTPHKHTMEPIGVFDSCIQYTLGGYEGERRVLGQAIMTQCRECGHTGRIPLNTWREARIARRLYGYI